MYKGRNHQNRISGFSLRNNKHCLIIPIPISWGFSALGFRSFPGHLRTVNSKFCCSHLLPTRLRCRFYGMIPFGGLCILDPLQGLNARPGCV